MSPVALALAVLLHALAVAALWWLAHHRPPVSPLDEAIIVSFEQPLPQPPPPINLGVPPPAPITSDRPTQVPPADQVSREPPAPTPPPESKEEEPKLPSQPEAAPPTPEPPIQARVEPPPAPAEKPSPEPPTALGPKVTPSPPPPQQAAPARPREAAPPSKPQPQQQALATPPAPSPPAPKPSPLATAPTQRPPSASEPPSQHRFVNPADTHARAKVTDNYLSEVLRKIVGYRYQTISRKQQGVTVVRIVIARDGRLLSATVISSSGEPEFDNGVLAGVRAGAPYSPLPESIKGASAPFDLPIVSVRR